MGTSLLDILASLLGSAGRLLRIGGDICDGGRQLLHRAGLLHRSLAQTLCAVRDLPAGRGNLSGGDVDLADGIAQLHLQSAHGQQDRLELTYIGLPMGGIDVEVFIGHLVQQIGDVIDDDVQAGHHICSGAGQLGGLILPDRLGDRGL